MPNWCSNTLIVAGEQTELLRFAESVKGTEDGEETGLTFQHIKPEPPNIGSDGTVINGVMPDWYQWRVENWGTKWDASDVMGPDLEEATRWSPAKLTFSFMTAWAPPQPVILKASQDWPTLTFVLSYDEGGMDFGGYDVYQKGERVEYEEGNSRATTWADAASYRIDDMTYEASQQS